MNVTIELSDENAAALKAQAAAQGLTVERWLLVAEPLVASAGRVRLVFRHMPMARHEWAQKAAEAAACAQLQNGNSFWRLHDAVFENQEGITGDNVSQKVDDLASQIGTLNIRDFRDCLRRQTSLGMVLRDQQLGTLAGVKGTHCS